jgi:hypothetical protein
MRCFVVFSALTLAACGPRPIVSVPPAACAKLLPADWTQGVPAEPIPADDDWASAYVGQTGQLAKANGRLSDAIGIFSRCEAMVNAARPER